MPLTVSANQTMYDYLESFDGVDTFAILALCPYKCPQSVATAVGSAPGLQTLVLEVNGAFGILSALFTLDEVTLDTTIAIEGKKVIVLEDSGQLVFPDIDLTGLCGCGP